MIRVKTREPVFIGYSKEYDYEGPYKKCKKCNEIKPLNLMKSDNRNISGCASECNECYSKRPKNRLPEYYKNYRKNNIQRCREINTDYKKRNRKKANASNLIKKHVDSGKIIRPKTCDICWGDNGGKPIEGHHPNYEKPLEVIWVCRSCHKNIHRKYNRGFILGLANRR